MMRVSFILLFIWVLTTPNRGLAGKRTDERVLDKNRTSPNCNEELKAIAIERHFHIILQARTGSSFTDLIGILENGFKGSGDYEHANTALSEKRELAESFRLMEAVGKASRTLDTRGDVYGIEMDIPKNLSTVTAERPEWRAVRNVPSTNVKVIYISIVTTDRSVQVISQENLIRRLAFYRSKLEKFNVPLVIRIQSFNFANNFRIEPGRWEEQHFELSPGNFLLDFSPTSAPPPLYTYDRAAWPFNPRRPGVASFMNGLTARLETKYKSGNDEETREGDFVELLRHGESPLKYMRTDYGFDDLQRWVPDNVVSRLFKIDGVVLDIGTGEGRLVDDLRARGLRAYGLEPVLNEEQRRRNCFIEAEPIRTGLTSSQFETIVVSNTMGNSQEEWLRSPRLAEMKRLLKTGGSLVLLSEAHRNDASGLSGFQMISPRSAKYIELRKISD